MSTALPSSTPSELFSADSLIANQRASDYTYQLWYLLASLIIVVGVCQYTTRFLRTNRHRAPSSSAISWRRLPCALMNTYRIIAFRTYVGLGRYKLMSIAEAFLTIAYIAALLTWEFVNTTDLDGNSLSVTYWGSRAGALAASQFPLITSLGTKNNILTVLTGVSYDKLNYLHRMAVRVVAILVWIHAGEKLRGGLDSEKLWLQAGLVAAVALTALCVISLRPIRAKVYEFFFYSHFALVLIFLVMAFYHTSFTNHQSFIWPCFVVWGLDRFLRLIRLLIFNIPISRKHSINAHAELLSNNLVRLTVKRPSYLRWAPGQSAFLTLPTVSRLPFEAHPFSIASYNSDSDSDWVFLIQGQDGFTRRLVDEIARKPKGHEVAVLMDGPYGTSPEVEHCDTVVLVAGGTGVSHVYPVFLDIVEKVRKGKSVCKRLVFIWAVRDADDITWISNGFGEVRGNAPDGLDIEMQIFVTGNLGAPIRGLNYGRPDLSACLAEEVEGTRGGRVGVIACGSASVAHNVRSALGFGVAGPGKVLRGGADVILHVESFGYA